jgi:hypothetical protein
MEALGVIGAQLPQQIEGSLVLDVLDVLDALDDRRQIEPLGDPADAPNDPALVGGSEQSAHEAQIDLDVAERQPLSVNLV